MADSLNQVVKESPNAVAERLLRRAHNLDGLPEIAGGLLFLIFAGFLIAQVVLPHQSIGFVAACLASAILMPLLGFGTPRALRWVRSRFLIERVGYFRPKPIGLQQIGIGILIVAGTFIVLFGVVPQLSQPNRWLLAGSGIFAGAIAALGGRSLRFVILGVLTSVAGLLVSLSGVSLSVGFAILWGFAGLSSLLSGCVVFLRFMRKPFEAGE